MTRRFSNEDFETAPAERTLIYDNECLIGCRPAVEKIYHNTDGTFDALVLMEGEIAAEWENCPSVEYAAASIEEFDLEP